MTTSQEIGIFSYRAVVSLEGVMWHGIVTQ
jgi:hypothetical protein